MESLILGSQIFRDLEGISLWLAVFGVALAITIVVKTVLYAVCARLKYLAAKTPGMWDDLVVEVLSQTKVWALFVWISTLFLPILHLGDQAHKVAKIFLVISTTVQAIIWGIRAIGAWKHSYLEVKVAHDASAAAAIGLLSTGLQMFVITTASLIAMSNLGIDVGALVAGLGIGGIAVALAAQNVLGDLLASLSIVLDKPFEIGDFIRVGDQSGTVEYVGIKTTRLRSLSGEQLVFANKDLLESRIQNYKRMRERRVVHTVGVVYSTPIEKLDKIPTWITEIINAEPMFRLDWCYFVGYGASSLDFEVAFYVKDPDLNTTMKYQQQWLMSTFKKLKAEGVDFAFPSQTVYLARDQE